jgi:TorA maturation chaperone TorD
VISAPEPVRLHHRLAPEDASRAGFYALLARLYGDPPDGRLLTTIAAAPRLPVTGAANLAQTFNRLADASSAMDPDAAAQEYTDLFVGVGKSEIDLHASHWLPGPAREKPLVALRSDLARLGLGRQPGAVLMEDHLSALCETMRLLITGNGAGKPADIATQRAFFERHLGSWAFACCGAIQACSLANYYRCVAEFTDTFMALDRDAFAVE